MNISILLVVIAIFGLIIIWWGYKTIKTAVIYIVNREEIKQSYFGDLALLTVIISLAVLFIFILMFCWVMIL